MGKYIIDAHAHLWLYQDTIVNGLPICQLKENRSRSRFLGENMVQMLPPFMIDGRNSAEVFLSNMDYAQVSAAVITQEFIDGQQNDYLETIQRQYPDRFFTFGMPDTRKSGFYQETVRLIERGFKGIKIPAARLPKDFLNVEMKELMLLLEKKHIILGIELQEGDVQVGQMNEVIQQCPNLKIVIGHFGMVTRSGWMSQIKLARHENVFIESGGITWLFNDEFYPFPSAVRAIREAADEVGWNKLMWGSDYPRTITAITYKMSYDFVTKSQELTDEQKSLFLSDNAKQFFGFGELIELPYIKNMSE
jgi:predicted TIM-barrel fold metal-dependent hydrolase